MGSDLAAGFLDTETVASWTSDQGSFFAFCNSPGCTPDPLQECIDQAGPTVPNVGFAGELATNYSGWDREKTGGTRTGHPKIGAHPASTGSGSGLHGAL